MNPLLAPPYVSGTLPFDSMDLSLQSTRSNPAALPPHNKQQQQQQQQQQTPPHQQQQQQSQQQQQQQQSHLHVSNYPQIHNLTTNASTGLPHPQQQNMPQHAQVPSTVVPPPPTSSSLTASINPPSLVSNKFLNANGSDCESLLPPPPTTPTSNHQQSSSNNSAPPPPPPHYMQAGSREESFKLAQLKRSFEHEKSLMKPVELINKDCSYAQGAGKLPGHNLAQQKKTSSPLRNYHQQLQQQQQQLPSYNLPPAGVKCNGPQTPPTPTHPQSPIMQQQSPLASLHQMQSPASGAHGTPLDYNQLHLHHHLHAGGSYGQPEPQQSLHYSTQSHHNQPHLPAMPQQQSQQQQQKYHASLQQQLQQLATPPPLPPPPLQQQQQPQQQSQQSSTGMTVNPTQMPHSLTNQNLDLPQEKKAEQLQQQHQQQNVSQAQESPVITDLSGYRNSSNAGGGETSEKAPQQLPEAAPESPYLTTSNEESLESNSNSSCSRKRRKRKASMVMRLTPAVEEEAQAVVAPTEKPSPQANRQRTPSQSSQSPSKQSPKNGGTDFKSFGLQSDKEKAAEAVVENGASPGRENSNSSTAIFSDDNPKTKKQRQALLQRNLTEQNRQQEDLPAPASCPATPVQPLPLPPSPQSNSSSSSSSSSSGASHSTHSTSRGASEAPKNDNIASTDTPASPALVEQGNIDAKPAVSVHEVDEEDAVIVSETQTKTSPEKEQEKSPKQPVQAEPASPRIQPGTNPTTPRHFGEVEDKLEQMFAGIEDEPSDGVEASIGDTSAAKNAHLSTQLATEKPKEPPTPTAPATEPRPMATKASMKSTLPSPIHSPSTQLEARQTSTPVLEATPEQSPSAAKAQPSRRMPPRRLSVGLDPSLLRFSLDEVDKPKKSTPTRKKPQKENLQLIDSDDDKPSTSAAAAAALAARQLSEAAAAQALQEASQNTTPKTSAPAASKKKNAKGGAANNKAGGKGGKANASNKKPAQTKKQANGGNRKAQFTTDEDSNTPAPPSNGGAADLKLKSPYILVKPDGSVTIKNTHSSEDVNEKQTKVKKAAHERKNLRGMHSSTLSNRYDADTTDSSWICVFCKRGPHKLGLGDLFGPYLVSVECEEYRTALQAPGAQDIDSLFVSTRKRMDMVQTQQRNLPVVPATLAVNMQTPKITMHKRKRKHTHDSSSDNLNDSMSSTNDPLDVSHEAKFIETFRGMCKTSEHGYEVWLHEDCAVWTLDIHLIGAQIKGLDAAVWDSTRYQCSLCAQPGANVCCFERSCKITAHVPCARVANWMLSEKDRKVYCEKHTPANYGSSLGSTTSPQSARTTTTNTGTANAAATTPLSGLNVKSLP